MQWLVGGDKFTLLLPQISGVEDITNIGHRILDVLSAPFYLESQELYVTASLGIALVPYDGEDAEMLLKNADIAMYRAKRNGKGLVQLGWRVRVLEEWAGSSERLCALSIH